MVLNYDLSLETGLERTPINNSVFWLNCTTYLRLNIIGLWLSITWNTKLRFVISMFILIIKQYKCE
jgi:hypothetical protein